MTMTTTEIFGVMVRVLELFSQERNSLVGKGLVVDGLTATMNLFLEEARAADAMQESLKRQLKSATDITNLKLRRGYNHASGMIDMAMAAVDKTTSTAKNFQSIRSKARRIADGEEIVPLPVPTPIEAK